MSTLTVSFVQSETRWHDPAANRALFDRALADVPTEAELVVLPEMFSTGFTMASREQAEPMDGPTVAWLRERAAQRGQVLTGSVVIEEGGAYWNRLLWVTPAGDVTSYDKRHRFRMAGEHEHYSAGSARVVVRLGAVRVLLAVCYDLRFPVFARNRNDFDLYLIVANWPAARQSHWDTLLRARAIENQAFVVGVNRVGTDGNEVAYGGGSAAIDFQGEPLVAPGDAAGVFTARLDLAALADYRGAFPAWQDADDFTLATD
ncbi:MAG: amidohydrolase [Pseudomonadota bacterium]